LRAAVLNTAKPITSAILIWPAHYEGRARALAATGDYAEAEKYYRVADAGDLFDSL
jgi:hypothetical protein